MGRNLGACERGVLEVLKPSAALSGTAGVAVMPFYLVCSGIAAVSQSARGDGCLTSTRGLSPFPTSSWGLPPLITSARRLMVFPRQLAARRRYSVGSWLDALLTSTLGFSPVITTVHGSSPFLTFTRDSSWLLLSTLGRRFSPQLETLPRFSYQLSRRFAVLDPQAFHRSLPGLLPTFSGSPRPLFRTLFPHDRPCKNNGRQDMTDWRWRPDMTESPSTGSGGQSSVLCRDGLPVYREILRPHNAVIQSVHNLHLLSIHIFQMT